ncbi:MAG: hypothetical protein SFY95_11040 [Planctomycetota bacterium]|nr:hypothetical protein [Planctomycetota bacterium]
MQWLFQNSQVVFLLLIVGFSVLSWVMRKLQEQSIKRRREQAEQARQMEMLRTGRDPSTGEAVRAQPGVVPQASMPAQPQGRPVDAETLRQRQLQELRRRARERSRQQPGGGGVVLSPVPQAPPRVPSRASGSRPPSGTMQPTPFPAGTYPPRQAPSRASAPKPAQPKATPARQAPKRPAQPQRQYQPGDGESTTTSVFGGTPAPLAPALAARPNSDLQLARIMKGKSVGQAAFVLTEIFGSPVSRRGDDRGFSPEGMQVR